MSPDADPRAELLAAIDGLTDEKVRTMLGWTDMLRRGSPDVSTPRSVGALGDLLGIASEPSEPGRSRMRLDVDPAWNNPHGVLHGGVVYTMLDYSMGMAVMSVLPAGEHCATIEVKISYLVPVAGGSLTVQTDIVKRGRNIAFTESKVTDDSGRLVATGSGSMFILRPNSTPQQEPS